VILQPSVCCTQLTTAVKLTGKTILFQQIKDLQGRLLIETEFETKSFILGFADI
jgi:hypothetical protein